VILALKGIDFVLKNISSITNNEICYQLDTDDFENETEDQKELNELEKINQISHIFYNFYRNKLVNDLIVILKEYKIEYVEFTTPPPQFT
jgi:uncharacterized protein (DUF1015 family)